MTLAGRAVEFPPMHRDRELQPRIIADGPERLREACDYRAVRRRIFAELEHRHAPELQAASFWRRLWLRLKIEREARAALRRRFPAGSLHVARVTSLADASR